LPEKGSVFFFVGSIVIQLAVAVVLLAALALASQLGL
jgi:hypothetical protein